MATMSCTNVLITIVSCLALDSEIAAKELYPVDDASRSWFTRRMCDFYREMCKKHITTGTSGDFGVQLYDVESKSNGLLSFDRAISKVDPATVARAARGEHRSSEALVPGPSLTYQNPIDFSYPYFDGKAERTIRELRDPAIIREGDLYYLTFTVFPFTHSDSRSATKIDCNSPPGIMLYSSADLKRWKFERWLIKSSDLPDDCPYKHRFWAPEIHKIRGKFYLIFTSDNWIKDEYNRGGKIGAYVAFVGVADNVTGPYRHITWLKGAGCDTTLFGDDDGKIYAIMPFGDQFIQEVDLTGIERGDIKLIGQRKMIVRRSNSDVGKITSPDYLEGPWMIKRNGKFVLFTAAPYRDTKKGASAPDLAQGYWAGAAVADNVWGPYMKQPQVFLGGHVAVFTGPDGRPWFSYRGESGGNAQGRLCVDPIEFHPDGSIWPFEPSMGPKSWKNESLHEHL
jgi:xylan 1,4-beta-xylosidase